MTERLPIALPLRDFLNLPKEDREPLLGDGDKALIPAGGLVLLGGKAGLGKTTLIVDAIFHFASGLDWLKFPTPRPLNVLVIENEGPMPMFQQKLASKHAVWKHPMLGSIHIQTGAWGYFSFADLDHHTALKGYLDEHEIDLVVGDPIGTLGMEGVGSPDETRSFVKLLIPLGLFANRAFIFPVHFTKEARKDEVDQISGSWGGHLDTLMVLKQTRRKDELRLSFPKLRWWNDVNPTPMIIGKVYNTLGFEYLRDEGEKESIEDLILELLKDGVPRTVKEIAPRNGGVGAREADVKATLEARPDLFRWASGADHGRAANAIVWTLLPLPGSSASNGTAQPSQTPLLPPQREHREHREQHPQDPLLPDAGSSREQPEQSTPAAELSAAPTPTPVGEWGAVAQRPARTVLPDAGAADEPNGNVDEYELERLASIAAMDEPFYEDPDT